MAKPSSSMAKSRSGFSVSREAAPPSLGARDGRLRVPATDRLRRGGVPARGGQHAAALQGGHERARGGVPGNEGAVLPGLPGSRSPLVPERGGGRAGRGGAVG